MLVINNLTASYNKKQAPIITDLCLSVNKGEILNVLGQNAVGKTTLLRCLTKQLHNFTGQILVDGKDVREYSIRDYSKKVGVVSTAFESYQNLLVADYLVTGFINQSSPFQNPHEEHIEKAYEVLKTFRKESLFNKGIDQLSSGERQLVMISRVILQNPDIIIVDEPTANLDVKNQIAVLDQMQLLQAKGYTVIITTHNPGHALTLGGKTLLMKQGRYTFGTTSDMVTSQNMEYYYDLSVKSQSVYEDVCLVFSEKDSNNIRVIL